MRALRLGLRAYRDFYDHIWWMLALLVAWWLLTVTIIFGPPATFLLFHLADPRQGVWEDRLTPRECARYLTANWARAWKVWLVTGPLLALVIFNLNFYGGSDHVLAVLAPIWLILLVMVAVGTITIFAVGGVNGEPAKATLKRGARLALVRLPQLTMIVLITAVVPYLLITSVLAIAYPLLVAVPGVMAMGISRYVLQAQNLAFPQPNDPTDERLRETRTR